MDTPNPTDRMRAETLLSFIRKLCNQARRHASGTHKKNELDEFYADRDTLLPGLEALGRRKSSGPTGIRQPIAQHKGCILQRVGDIPGKLETTMLVKMDKSRS